MILLIGFLLLLVLAGFVPIYRTRRRLSTAPPSRDAVIALLKSAGIVALLPVLGAVLIFGVRCKDRIQRYRDSQSHTVEEARRANCPIPLPDSAHDVRFVDDAYFPGFAVLVRFEAPIDDCRREVQIVADARAKHAGHSAQPVVLDRIVGAAAAVDAQMVEDAPWFDIHRIAHCETDDATISASATQFWIDADRGVFYCYFVD